MDVKTNIIMNKNEILEQILKNMTLLFNRRNYTNKDFNKLISSSMLKDFQENQVIYIDDDNKLSIIYFDTEIKNISTGTEIDEYLNKKNEYKKFILCKNFNRKVYKAINDIYKNSEMFFIHEFLEDIPSKKIIPDHKLLNAEEKKELLTNFKKTELPMIYKSDIMCRYFNGQVNDIFRIKRYNLNCGISIAYRIVIQDNMDILF
jgi:DNA-directed RNA polymerase subunit H (RpoH/RPB5)